MPQNPKKLTREQFETRYWGKGAATVPASTRREFYSDYRESGMAFDKYKASTSQPYANPVTLLGAGGKRADVAAAQKRITALYRLGYELNAKGWHHVDLIGQGSRLYGHGTSPSDLTPVSADEARRLNAYVAGNKAALQGLGVHERLHNPANEYLDMVERSARAVLNERIRAQGSSYHGDNERGLETALKMAQSEGCGPDARALVRKVLKDAPATTLSPGIAFARSRAREARRKLGSRANSEDRVFVRNPARAFRPYLVVPSKTHLLRRAGFDKPVPAYGRVMSTGAGEFSDVARVQWFDATNREMDNEMVLLHDTKRVSQKPIKNPATPTDMRTLRDALVANGIEARLTKTGITVSLSHGGKRTARIVPAGYVGASFAILFSNGERGDLRTDGRWSPRDAARSVLDALMSRSMQESQRLHGEHVRTQNPRGTR